MPEELPSPRTIEGMLVRVTIVYTKTTLTINYQVKVIPYILTLIAAVAIFVLFLGSRNQSFFIIGIFISVPLCAWALGERSYRYEFDKEHQKIRQRWVGFQGIFIDNRKDVIYPLRDLSHLSVKVTGRYGNVFKLKAVLQNGKELEIPYGHLLGECMGTGNEIRDFLEISAPIKLP